MFLVSVQAAAALQQQKPRPFGRCRSSVLPHCKRKTSTRCVLVDGAAEVGLYEQISRLNNHRPFRLPLMRAVSLNFFGTLSVRYELLAPM